MRLPRKKTFLVFLAAGLVLPALFLSLLGVRLLRDFTNITRSVRTDYGDYMARIAVNALEDAFWEQEQLNMVAARLVPPENPAEVKQFLNRFQDENPLYQQAFFVSPVGLVYYPDTPTTLPLAFVPPPDWVLDPIMASLPKHHFLPSSLNHITAPDSLPPAEVTYFTLHSDDGELLGVAGFVWNLNYVQAESGFIRKTLTKELENNPDVFRGALSPVPVAVTLMDETGRPFYQSKPGLHTDYIGLCPFTRVLPFYKVGIQLQNDRFESWVRSVVITDLAVIVTMFLVILVAVAFTLRYVLHEMELAEVKSNFVSNVSHELKTPLALIRLFSETLELDRVPDPERRKEFLRVIHKESQRLTHLINNVLDVNRIEQGRKTYRIRPVDLAAVINETLAAYDFQLRQQGFEVDIHLAGDLPEVPADAEAVTQALLNLMDNAIKYSKDRKFLRVELSRRDGEACILVQDRGVGIPPREQDRIFDKFYRVEKGLIHDVKGSGLGLSLVRHIVDAHHGRITLESRLGEGSTFMIFLPLGDTSQAPDGQDPGQEEHPV
jgi:signal transduction histidine kinase